MTTAREVAAVNTLLQLGYTWEGGVHWKPPLGPRPMQVAVEAARIFQQERHQAAVQKEVERLRAKHARPWWRRLLDLLPFTITRRK